MLALADLTSRLRRSDNALSGLVALAFLTLMPPAVLDGRVSVLELSAILVAGALVVTRRGGDRAPVGVPTVLILLLTVMLASAVWSNDSWATARDALSYALLAVFAWIVVRDGGMRSIVNGMCAGVVVVLTISFGLLIIDPAAALYYDSSGFQGIYANRNAMGFILVQALPAVLSLRAASARAILGKAVLLVVVLGATLATTSRTALLVSLVLVALWVTLVIARRWRWALVAFGAAVAFVAVIALANFERVLDLLGKTASLNGRAVIWDAVVRMIPESPLIGFGWSRSWTPGSPHSEAVAGRLQGQIVFHAHNELLNWLITTGVIGTVVVVALFTLSGVGGTIVARRGGTDQALLPVLIIAATIGRGVTEISETNALGWVGLMLAVFGVARYAPEVVERRIPPLLLLAPRRRAPVGPDRLGDSANVRSETSGNGVPSV